MLSLKQSRTNTLSGFAYLCKSAFIQKIGCTYEKILSTLFLLTVILFNALPSKAITYKEASESNKPMAILVYASWVDNLEDIKKAFSNMEINIASLTISFI